ncbi:MULTISPECIES: hypothetical protein [Dickeya]|uniref:hypothetical protein n=1 Tax=Dickeya TaxID=204037 RepID=UPI0002F180E8|nr:MULTISPECIES: hypothetical protein [Dickeya]MBP2837426.1 hypothetical protein [Dickeya parazeae]UCZ73712.1 hypothetical protein LHK94_11635 [Dickeya zeae]
MADATPPSYFNRYFNHKNNYPYPNNSGYPKAANTQVLTQVNGWGDPINTYTGNLKCDSDIPCRKTVLTTPW